MDATTIHTSRDADSASRVEALLAQMTLPEKVGQLTQIDLQRVGVDAGRDRIRAGQVGSLLGPIELPDINHLQRLAVEESRLGIPLLIGNDVIHGYRTIFPIPLAEACTWSPDLIQAATRVAAEEATAHGTDWIFAPMVDICRDPRWGRIAEGAGEDPCLGAAIARARVRGVQAPDLRSGRRAVACPKHFAAYGAAEAGRDYNTVDISERTLRDVYLPPFQAAFEAGAVSVMSAFNDLNGIPVTMNAFLLRQLLRQEWGFHGVVLSDYNAVAELVSHGVAQDLQQATQLSLEAGLDMDMVSDGFHRHLTSLVQGGQISLSRLDTAVRRVLTLKMHLGLFEHPYTDASLAPRLTLTPEHRQLALEVAQRSMVLLKNDSGLLPLSSHQSQSIALIGPLADDHQEILGCWSCAGRAEDAESVRDGLCAVLPDADITYVQGCDLEGASPPDIAAAAAAARAAAVAILVLGEGAYMSGEAHSRAHLSLPGHQQALLQAVHATGTPVVVVLMSGRPLVVPWLVEHVPAILQAWHGGIRTGRAVADLLLGNANPSGKLTVSWPRAEGQIPVYHAHRATGRPAEGEGTVQFNKPHWSIFIDEQNAPQFPFGCGLSYSTFSYRDLTVHTPAVTRDGTLRVSVTIANTSDRTGDEVVQLYVRDLVGSVTRPVKELKGFQRITLTPGEMRVVDFDIPVSHLGFHGMDLTYRVESGAFRVWVGPHAEAGLEGAFEVV